MPICLTLPRGLHGISYVNGVAVTRSGRTFEKFAPGDGSVLGDIDYATDDQIETALSQAWAAFEQDTITNRASRIRRAEMLDEVAAQLEARKEEIRITYGVESALPSTKSGDGQPPCRFDVEFGRTVTQLRFHATRLRNHTHYVPVVTSGTPFGTIVKTVRGIGPVLVLGAINFPLAFSTAGGDFADAWASGCPVVMKAHAEHPLTSELVAQCIIAALKKLGMHQGWFALIHCERQQTLNMVADKRIAAVAITGSLGAAMAIKAVADRHNKPVYAECGSTNPVFFSPGKIALCATDNTLADTLVGSVTGGAGQFCTCPGLLIAIKGTGFKEFFDRVVSQINSKPAVAMLSARTKKDFTASVGKLLSVPGMSVAAGGGEVEHATQTKPTILTISGAAFLANPEACQHEAFGHCSVIVQAENMAQALAIAQALTGNLTATRYGSDEELASADWMHLLRILETKAGRHIANNVPTGVAVCASMNHGGPFPACTINATSVGGSLRFMVEISYQGQPDATLPRELQASNPDGIMRLQNNVHTTAALVA